MIEQMTHKLEVQVLKSPVSLFNRVHESMPPTAAEKFPCTVLFGWRFAEKDSERAWGHILPGPSTRAPSNNCFTVINDCL